MDRVVLPKVGKKEIRVLDKQGLSQLLEAVSGTDLFPLFVTAASTGCRRGELLALEWQDIDFQTGMMTISKSLEQTRSGLRIKSTKSDKVRRFPLPSVALDVLSQHRRTQPLTNPMEPNQQNPGLVFCRPEGDYYKRDQISSRVAEIMAKAGLCGISLHSLRHAHASQLLSEGVPIPTVSKRLGHANPTITLKLYSHALESDELAAAQRWDNAFADVVELHTNATPIIFEVHQHPSPKSGVETGVRRGFRNSYEVGAFGRLSSGWPAILAVGGQNGVSGE